ncbi:MFS general substrate transporter [Pleurotus eryngii]|uniref:MFS general substrate transporter n=1 Tax=Pleurotus eryngii TaxID=5323 RepID=A0A9P6DFU7_PLEER|nr:MFS general substrate transporter [Pleurotus eryngii]
MSQTLELREIETISKSVSESVHEVESLPKRLHAHGDSSQSTAQPTTEDLQEILQTSPKQQAVTARVQFATLCWCLFMAGWNDGTTGPLLPRIREVYNVGFAVVSLIFVFACVGFIGGALLNVPLSDKLGFGKVIVLGSILQVIAYALQAPALPFPVFVIAYVINGVGIAMQDAQANGYVASIKENAETKMGILHATYGLGAFAAPLVATQFAQIDRWSFHYLVSLGVALSNAVALAMVFRFKGQDECLTAMGQPVGEKDSGEHSKFRQILTQKTVHFLAFFILAYVGVEVTIGGWIVTFIIDVRHGGPSSGYISSGFFGGLTVGRVALLWVNKKIGERRVLYLYTFLAIGLELIVWLVPSLIGDAVAVSLVGVLLGPFYPIAMNHAGRIIPRWLLTGSIGWIAGFGQAGSAVIPFMTGALASKYGIQSLQPLLVAMMVLMIILWTLVPRAQRRED